MNRVERIFAIFLFTVIEKSLKMFGYLSEKYALQHYQPWVYWKENLSRNLQKKKSLKKLNSFLVRVGACIKVLCKHQQMIKLKHLLSDLTGKKNYTKYLFLKHFIYFTCSFSARFWNSPNQLMFATRDLKKNKVKTREV